MPKAKPKTKENELGTVGSETAIDSNLTSEIAMNEDEDEESEPSSFMTGGLGLDFFE